MTHQWHCTCLVFGLFMGLAFTRLAMAQASEEIKTFKVGEVAKDVEFLPLEGNKKLKLSTLAKDGPVVFVVLRGFPGYQCPLCSRQVRDLREHAQQFDKLGAKVVLLYPGPKLDLKMRAREFLKDDVLPKPLLLVIDPAYQITNQFGLRWKAEAETAYPSTFVLDPKRKVVYRKISRSHGDRASAEEVLEVLAAMRFAATAEGEEIPSDQQPIPRQFQGPER